MPRPAGVQSGAGALCLRLSDEAKAVLPEQYEDARDDHQDKEPCEYHLQHAAKCAHGRRCERSKRVRERTNKARARAKLLGSLKRKTDFKRSADKPAHVVSE